MSLDDIFGPHPGRPQHRDMTILSDICLQHDGKTEDPTFDFVGRVNEIVDMDTLQYVAEQRAMRSCAVLGSSSSGLLLALTATTIDAFMIGAEYGRRRLADAALGTIEAGRVALKDETATPDIFECFVALAALLT